MFFMFIDWRVKREKAETEQKKSHREFTSLLFLSSFSLSSSVGGDISQVKSDPSGESAPQLLHSVQGHKKSITGLILSDRNQVLISSSVDRSVRLWSLSGQVFKLQFLNSKTWALKSDLINSFLVKSTSAP